MSRITVLLSVTILVSLALSGPVRGEEEPEPKLATREALTIRPEFLPPSQILDFLGVHQAGGLTRLKHQVQDFRVEVDISVEPDDIVLDFL